MSAQRIQYARLMAGQRAARGYRIAVAALCALALGGLAAAHSMDSHGHHITGMNNQVLWGIPHVFALGLILAASGALNVASLSSVFGVAAQRPLARLSALLAIVLLLGGLAVLVFDLGRPDRLIIALTHYNFRSVFAWNIWLYAIFIALAAAYLWAAFTPRAVRSVRPLGALAFVWRFILTSGSGAIFGFLVARPGFDAAILIPLFIALSLSLGGAAFALVARALARWHGDYLPPPAQAQWAQLLGAFVAVVLLLTLAFHLTNLYAAEHRAFERFILRDGGTYTMLFWSAQVIGSLAPLVLLFASHSSRIILAAWLIVIGGFAQLYVIIIAGQAFPTPLFPGKRVRSSFHDGVTGEYAPSLAEWLLGFGGIAFALLALLIVVRVMPFLPPPHRVDGRAANA